jgi:signal transduction histidine kinase
MSKLHEARSVLLAAVAVCLATVATPAAAAADQPQVAADTLKAAEAAMMVDPKQVLGLTRKALQQVDSAPATPDRERARARALWLEGEASGRLADIPRAERAIGQALTLVERVEPRSTLHARILMSRGATALDKGEVQRAFTSFRDAFDLFRRLSDTRGQALALQSMGTIYSDAGDHQRVLRYYAQSAEVHPSDPNLSLTALNNQGLAYKELGQLDRAESDFRKALVVARELGSPLLQARILTNIAGVELARGRVSDAQRTVDRGLAIASGEAAEWAPFLWGVKAQIAMRRGDAAEATRHLARTFGSTPPEQTNYFFRDFHQTASDAFLAIGDSATALRHLRAVNRLDGEVREIRSSANAALMAAQFDYSSQELRISKLKAGQLERDVALERGRARTQLIVLVAALLLLAATTAAFFWIRRSRNETRVANVQLGKALSAKSEFLATTSHEIRTPLNGIMGMTQVLLRTPDIQPAVQERIELIDGASKAMKAIIDDLLDMAKIEAGESVVERSEFAFTTLLDETARLWTAEAEGKGLTIVADLGAAPARIVEDERKLRQIVFNLMSNAVKFTEQGHVTLAARAEGDELVIAIEDTGIGIPADQMEAIFEPFHQVNGATTRQHSGTGLGLAISRKLATELGGRIDAQSELGRGSRFTLVLPLAVAAAPELSAAPAPDGPLTLANARVLLVDANPLFQSLVTACLEDTVRTVVAVDGVADALALRSGFDLLILDIGTVKDAAVDQLCADPSRLLYLLPPGADPAVFSRPAGAIAIAKAMPPLNIVDALEQLLAAGLDPAKMAA